MQLNVQQVKESQLQDRFQRRVTYMRISVIEHCNYACTYCMPAQGWEKKASKELLSFDEIIEIIEIMSQRGLRKVRITGGEPLLRKNLPELIARIKQIPYIQHIALTTNGHLLAAHASRLIQAGLNQLNVSVDTFDAQAFHHVTRGGDLQQVICGIKMAQSYGITPIKVNAVLTTDIEQNLDQWIDFCQQAWRLNCIPRWIEVMPMGNGLLQQKHVDNQKVLQKLTPYFHLQPVSSSMGIYGPASYWQVTQGPYAGQQVGFINPMSDDGFCSTCNRIRLSATGQLRACLADDRSVDLRSILRMGLHGPALIPFIESALYGKDNAHHMHLGTFPQTPMTHVGG